MNSFGIPLGTERLHHNAAGIVLTLPRLAQVQILDARV
jgi:hypothetical protein